MPARDDFASDEAFRVALRDWFAGQLIQTALLNVPFEHPRDSWQGGLLKRSAPAYRDAVARWRKDLANETYALADAMIAARSK